MPRRSRRSLRGSPLPPFADTRRVETGPDGRNYEVRTVAAARATKSYRCPGCDHEIRCSTAHVVAWPADAGEHAAEDRRHWHTACWTHRATRSPTRKWS